MARSPKGSIVHAIPSFYPRRMATATQTRPAGTGLTDNIIFYNNSQDGSYLVVWDATVTVAVAASQTTIPIVQGGPNAGGTGSGVQKISFVNSTTAAVASGSAMSLAQPSGLQNGDLLIALIEANGNWSTFPTGWSTITDTARANHFLSDNWPPSIADHAVMQHVFAPSDPANYTWGNGLGNAKMVGTLLAYRGASGASFDAATSGNLQTTTPATTPGVTTTIANDWILTILGLNITSGGLSVSTPPGDETQRQSLAATASQYGYWVGDKLVANPVAVPAESFTLSQNGTTGGATIALIPTAAIAPASGAGTNYPSVTDQGALSGSFLTSTGGSLGGASPYTFLEGAGNWRWEHDWPFVVIRPGASYQFQLTGDTGGWAVSLIWEVVRNL